MRILWLSNTPGMGIEFINGDSKIKDTGGWMYALNKAIQSEINLSVMFHYPYKINPFMYQDTMFYSVYTGNIIFENLKKRLFGKIYDKDFLKVYIDLINQINPDLIHIHGTENPFLCILNNTKIPVVISIQGNLTVYQHKYLSGFHGKQIHKKLANFNLKAILFGRNNFRKEYLKMKKMSIVEQNHLKNAKFIIGRTNWDRRITRILAPESIYYLGNEILRDGFYHNCLQSEIAINKIKIFTTNGDNYYKGFETLCYTLKLLINLKLNVEWKVAGISEKSLINVITKRVLGEKYPEKGLVLLGSIDENELIGNLLESNIYVMTSHIENSPNNLSEAMILGLPCIATFAGGTSSLLNDGVDGIIVQDGDPWAMAGAILELIKNPETANKYGKSARNRALSRHNKQDIVSQYLKIYSDIISNSKGEN